MTVKEVICEALRLAGREETAADMENESGTAETARLRRALLTYLNAVRDELARGYLPLYAREKLHSDDGAFAFAQFGFTPFKIKRVSSCGKPVKWHISPDYLIADGRDIEVEYSYVPAPLKETDEFSYPCFAVGERLVEYGMVAEYYLVIGDAASSAAWESKYRNEIDALLSHVTVGERIPPRRWI